MNHQHYHAQGPVYMFDTYPLVRNWFEKYERLEEINRARAKLRKMPKADGESNNPPHAQRSPSPFHLLRPNDNSWTPKT